MNNNSIKMFILNFLIISMDALRLLPYKNDLYK